MHRALNTLRLEPMMWRGSNRLANNRLWSDCWAVSDTMTQLCTEAASYLRPGRRAEMVASMICLQSYGETILYTSYFCNECVDARCAYLKIFRKMWYVWHFGFKNVHFVLNWELVGSSIARSWATVALSESSQSDAASAGRYATRVQLLQQIWDSDTLVLINCRCRWLAGVLVVQGATHWAVWPSNESSP